jgi:Isochorismatase family
MFSQASLRRCRTLIQVFARWNGSGSRAAGSFQFLLNLGLRAYLAEHLVDQRLREGNSQFDRFLISGGIAELVELRANGLFERGRIYLICLMATPKSTRRDGSDMGLYDDLYPPIADHATLVDGTPGIEIFSGLAPAPGEHVIKKHRYSAFLLAFREPRAGEPEH